jgi:hypothetical protein
MALSLTWEVLIGDIVTPTDFTSRMAGMNIDEQLTLNAMASFTATITLNNYDGALTPNGGGTYASWDWFTEPVLLRATVTGGASSNTADVFFGIVTDFDLFDDGHTSTVTLGVTDVWAVAGRTKQASVASFTSQSVQTYLTSPGYGPFGTAFPQFGYGAPEIQLTTTPTTRNIAASFAQDNVTFADLLSQMIVPAQNGFMWPGKFEVPASIYVYAYLNMMAGIPTSSTVRRFDPAGSITTTDMAFVSLQQGWSTDSTINTYTVTSIDQPFGPLPLTNTDTAAAQKYGARAAQSNLTACPAGDANDLSVELVNRFASPTFGPYQLTTNMATLRANCADAAYVAIEELFDIAFFLYPIDVTWTGTAVSSQTVRCAVLGKQFQVSPNDTTIILTLGDWVDYHAFTLDRDHLDVDRLG